MDTFTISELGKQVGLSAKTIRYYEEIGLIERANRSANKYREYTKNSVSELSLIKNARDLGLPIVEIRKLMKGCVDGDCEHTKEYVSNEIDTYVIVLQKKIEEMQNLHNELLLLKERLKVSECTGDEFCCNILSQLVNVTKGGDKNGTANM